MRIFLLLAFISIFQTSFAQENLAFDLVETPEGYEFRVDNHEVCPVSVKTDFKLKNLRIPGGRSQTYVIPAKAKNHLITEILINNKRKSTSINYRLLTALGDVTRTTYDTDFDYFLPFEPNSAYEISQGYDGSLSHQNFNALDFDMPIGTPVTAARGGLVVKVVEKHSRNCRSARCLKYNNNIKIYHSDGTFADYTHLKKDGALVKVGDQVEIGQLIGYSGNTGFSSGPHLHLAIYRRKINEVFSLKTKFLINNGEASLILEEGKSYRRDY